MADFVQMMKDWRRMCNSVPGKSESKSLCSDKESGYVCPLKYNGLCCKAIASQTDKDVISGENIIAAWAAEHPEPVYPSIAKYLEQFGITIRRDGSLQADFFKANEPMSADMAKLLGIEPKE